jgi:hypothetical protein
MKLLSAATILLLLAACSPRDSRPPAAVIDTLPGGVVSVRNYTPQEWRDSTTWHYVETGRVAPRDSGSRALVNPGFSAVVDGAGRIYVVDQSPTVIKVFDSTGVFVRTIGRVGAGPGEYRSPLLALRGPHLIVHDPGPRRITVFDTSGTLVTSFPGTCCVWGMNAVAVDDSDRVWVRAILPQSPDRTVAYGRFRLTGEPLDTVSLGQWHVPAVWVVEQEGGRATYGIPGGPRELSAVAPDGTILHAWSGAYTVAWQRTGADTLRLFTRDWTPVPVPQAERVSTFTGFAEMMTRSLGAEVVNRNFHLYDMPTERPPIADLDTDPAGRAWVRTATADTAASFYDVFSPSGIWQGTIRAPWNYQASVVWRGMDQVLVRTQDENGLGSFVVYRLERRVP